MRLTTILAGALALGAAQAAFAEGDPAAGEKAFRKCQACHQIGAEAQNKTGPVLTGVIGRPAASIEGFSYSKTLTEAAADGLVWDHAALETFLANPRKAMPGTKMAFPGIKKPQELADILAYLDTFSDGETREAEETPAAAPAEG
ncbi:c-type cytochrome [Rhodobacter sphaeroides]|jgi:cytochrome c|uniref:Isocytochrome c2 n=2 Tax=Cereibacter sphaeroides TaxID=1063 RepID=Q3J3A0_CERS4|nr:cytochrome c family protein [Cereibacter sphaeroides]ABN76345.1 cytochrome c, class I [Cereibacter sphaeroides ATCC 17029]EKX57170.1 Cytochrome c2 [Rhodobacter sp. AKP1]AAA61341.1 isocytochrome c2 precursor [Cereibacter sphaeroides]AAB09775.1 cytochrome c [Cereibacter sphaeroides]ABA78734.1 isocytochrome c2 [Cereibacter sphaeroides 2.4.1]